jgi:glycosyltransferase involved in cell wall biosynthesis
MAKYNIGITAGLETTTCPPEWIEGLNRMNLNIVPANFIKESLSKVVFDKHDEATKQKIGELKSTTPIEVLFEGADTEIYKPTKEFSKDLVDELKGIKEDFCFLFVGHWLQGSLGQDRKDLGMLIKTFYESFKNKKKQPALLLKTSGASPSVLDREDILGKIKEIKKTVEGKLPNIYVLHGDLSDDEMNGLYNHPKVKAHVSFTHGEGFGRPLLEASLSGKPVIQIGADTRIFLIQMQYYYLEVLIV